MSDDTFHQDGDPNDGIAQLAEDAAAKLMEHCDSVRIFLTVHRGEDSTSSAYSTGFGNFHAQYGQIQEWMIRQDERVRIHARQQEEE